MQSILLTLGLWAFIVLLNEFLWRLGFIRGEYARKFVHICISLSIAVTPYYMSWRQVQAVGIIGLICAAIIRYSNIIRSTYEIQRKSWGELIGPIAIIVLMFFEPSKLLFVTVMLYTGLADGVAAIIGTRFGKSTRYSVFGYTKSLAGTLAFYVTALIATMGVVYFGGPGNYGDNLTMLLIMPMVVTILENIGVYGIDNALIVFSTALLYANFT